VSAHTLDVCRRIVLPSGSRRRFCVAGVVAPACRPLQMPAQERDRMIVTLAAKGWSDERIGRAVGLTARGVRSAKQRISEGRPGRVRGE
jgi:DNA-binding NarL/FixJ family response regulator